jgi:hypothetical protein
MVSAHPGVVTLLGACLEPPCMCLIQELCEGGSLWDALHERGQRPKYGKPLLAAPPPL